jgi:hypothetical protein
MANTQTTVPTFVPGQVLEAAQLVNSAATGVPVFATTVTRDAGFGGAGEKTLAEGQLCYLESTNVVQYYDGAAWATLAPTPAASSGLTWIASQTLSGADTTFNSVFSAAYRNYFVTINNPSVSSGSSVIVSVQVGGQTSNYSNGQWSGNYTGSWGGLEVGSASTSKWEIGYTSGTGVDELAVMQFVLFNTFEAKRTIIQNNSTSAIATYQMGTGSHSALTSYSSMKILAASSTFNGGLVNIYGFSLS